MALRWYRVKATRNGVDILCKCFYVFILHLICNELRVNSKLSLSILIWLLLINIIFLDKFSKRYGGWRSEVGAKGSVCDVSHRLKFDIAIRTKVWLKYHQFLKVFEISVCTKRDTTFFLYFFRENFSEINYMK